MRADGWTVVPLFLSLYGEPKQREGAQCIRADGWTVSRDSIIEQSYNN